MLESLVLSLNSLSSLRVLDPDKDNEEYVRNIESCKYGGSRVTKFLFFGHNVGNNTK